MHVGVPWHAGSSTTHLADVIALALLEAHEEVVKAGVALVEPVVLDARAREVALLGQRRLLLLGVEGQVRA